MESASLTTPITTSNKCVTKVPNTSTNGFIHRDHCISKASSYDRLSIDEINRMGVTGSFYNLFDCSASRYTEDNRAETYLHQEHGLATIGSTKPGGIYQPQTFHEVLANGGNWGQGYKNWYENVGLHDDGWFLGIVIMGDTTLTDDDGACHER